MQKRVENHRKNAFGLLLGRRSACPHRNTTHAGLTSPRDGAKLLKTTQNYYKRPKRVFEPTSSVEVVSGPSKPPTRRDTGQPAFLAPTLQDTPKLVLTAPAQTTHRGISILPEACGGVALSQKAQPPRKPLEGSKSLLCVVWAGAVWVPCMVRNLWRAWIISKFCRAQGRGDRMV